MALTGCRIYNTTRSVSPCYRFRASNGQLILIVALTQYAFRGWSILCALCSAPPLVSFATRNGNLGCHALLLKVQGSFISHYLYKVNMEKKVQLAHLASRLLGHFVTSHFSAKATEQLT